MRRIRCNHTIRRPQGALEIPLPLQFESLLEEEIRLPALLQDPPQAPELVPSAFAQGKRPEVPSPGRAEQGRLRVARGGGGGVGDRHQAATAQLRRFVLQQRAAFVHQLFDLTERLPRLPAHGLLPFPEQSGQAFEVADHLLDVLIAFCGVLGHGPQQHGGELGGDIGGDGFDRLGVLLQDFEESRRKRIGVEGLAVGEQLVECRAGGEDVGAVIHALAADLSGDM